jgi:hypothetical protein
MEAGRDFARDGDSIVNRIEFREVTRERSESLEGSKDREST